MKKIRGFTLIELMVVVMVIAVLAAIAIPSYTSYIERRDLAIAKQEALRIAAELERFKAKNFSYKGFDASYLYTYDAVDDEGDPITNSYYNTSTGALPLPIGSTMSNAKYILTLVDADEERPLSEADIEENEDEGITASTIRGLSWVMAVERTKDSGGEPKQPRNYDLLLTSMGAQCMTKVKNVVSAYIDCGSDSEPWQ